MKKHTFWMKACLAGTAVAGLLLAALLTSSAGDSGRGHSTNKGQYYTSYGNRYTPHSRSQSKPRYPFPNRSPPPRSPLSPRLGLVGQGAGAGLVRCSCGAVSDISLFPQFPSPAGKLQANPVWIKEINGAYKRRGGERRADLLGRVVMVDNLRHLDALGYQLRPTLLLDSRVVEFEDVVY